HLGGLRIGIAQNNVKSTPESKLFAAHASRKVHISCKLARFLPTITSLGWCRSGWYTLRSYYPGSECLS
ncbi:MAG TPA: hypothetical protein VG713_01875, partial [Pirellulales bacterium]|nr:hypothetical protein [Pirellulales bacterium]